jgi:hypothetical protein
VDEDSVAVSNGGDLSSPTAPCFRRKNLRFSGAFSLAGKSPKSPASENRAPERVIFGCRCASASASPSAKTAEHLRHTATAAAGESGWSNKKWRGKGNREGNRLWARFFNNFNIFSSSPYRKIEILFSAK